MEDRVHSVALNLNMPHTSSHTLLRIEITEQGAIRRTKFQEKNANANKLQERERNQIAMRPSGYHIGCVLLPLDGIS